MSTMHDSFAPLDHFASSFLQGYHYDAAPAAAAAAAADHRYLYPRQPYHPPQYEYPHHYQQQHFDPRPPHAGWTPKQEIDDDAQRELLAHRTTPQDHLPSTSPTSPHSPLSGSPPTQSGAQPTTGTSKTYSFVSLPGNAVRKRPRRRYDEIERLYACAYPDCAKAYGTLNHLNAHVSMQRHGAKRSPSEFKELRKQWRLQKKQESVPPGSLPAPTALSVTPPAQPPQGSIVHSTETAPQPRRRRGTEPLLPPSHLAHPAHPSHPNPRLSLGDIRFPPAHSADEGPSPTSSGGSDAYWQEDGGNVGGSPPLGRLPPDSTLLAGYTPPQQGEVYDVASPEHYEGQAQGHSPGQHYEQVPAYGAHGEAGRHAHAHGGYAHAYERA